MKFFTSRIRMFLAGIFLAVLGLISPSATAQAIVDALDRE